MHQRFVELASEQCVGGGHGGRALALFVEELELHYAPFAGAGAGLAADAGVALAAGADAALATPGVAFDGAAFGDGPLTRVALVVGRTTLSRPRLPGTEPFIRSRCRPALTRTTSRA